MEKGDSNSADLLTNPGALSLRQLKPQSKVTTRFVMKPVKETYTIDQSRILEHRISARLPVMGIFLGIYILFLTLSILGEDSLRHMKITTYMFATFFVFTVLVCFFFSSRAERTVITITEDSIRRTVDGATTHIILLNEIGELKDFSRGFLIVKKGARISSTFYRRSYFEHSDFSGIIYVPKIMGGYRHLHNFIGNVLKSRKA